MPALQHGFTVEPTDDVDLNRLQQRIKQALDRLAAGATASQLVAHGRYVTVGAQNLQDETRGPDVASASAIAPRAAYQHITGATAIDFMATDGWFDGARIELRAQAAITFNHNTAAPPAGAYALVMELGVNLALASGQVVAFRRDDETKRWCQVD